MQLGILDFIRNQFKTVPAVVNPDLTGRVVIVTGSNVGLGYEAAVHLSRSNPARLILAVRNVQAGEAAARSITETNNGKCVPEVWKLDLGSLASVKAFGERVDSELDRLDIVLSNAGVNFTQFNTTADGFETTSQVNNVSNSLLSILVLPSLLRTASAPTPPSSKLSTDFKPHLTIVASEVHYWINPRALPGVKQGRKDPLQVMQEKEHFDPNARYIESKLINVLNVAKLSKLAGPSVIVNAVNPGLCHSSLNRDFTGVMSWFAYVLTTALARTTEQGARTLVWAATHPTPTGAFSDLCRVSEPLDWTFSPEGEAYGEGIWQEMKAVWRDKAGVDADQVLAKAAG